MMEEQVQSGGTGGDGGAANSGQARPAVSSSLPNPSGRQELVIILLTVIVLIRLTLSGVLGRAWAALNGG